MQKEYYALLVCQYRRGAAQVEGVVWDHEKTSFVELRTGQAVFEKIAYCLRRAFRNAYRAAPEAWPGWCA
jgi:hypothetical protein